MDVHAVPFRLSLASLPRHALAVRELHGREKLSGPYRFDLVCTAREPLPPLADLLQSAAVMTIWIAGSPRVFSGAVASVAHEGTRRDADGSEQIRVRIVPRFALRKHRKNSRIFQGLPVPEIVKTVLAEAGVPVEMRLRHQYPDRVYCTQYQETDTAFVARVLAEAGIFSFWQPPSTSSEDIEALDDAIWSGDTLVLGDTPSAYQEAATPHLPFLHAGGTLGPASGEVTRFVPRAAVRSERATFREYDAARPRAVLEASAEIPGREKSPLEIYDHEAPFLFSGWKVTEQEPGRRLQIARGDAQLAHGESTAPHLAAGHRFTLESHPWEPANGSHVVLEVHHEGWATPQGQSPERYRNRFVTAPAVETMAPRGPRQRTLGFTLTATVTGPPGEEIHVDEQGRIKAQFHWDREGKHDDRSSCWLRVMQSWSGTGWGSQFVPRVGMEVVISFEGGDPDKPMVLGCLTNGTHPPPFGLPLSKTQSGLRTQSSPGGGGFNELSFEDRAGHERLYVFAQRDLDEVVSNNRSRVVRANESVAIQGTEHRTVGSSQEETVQGDVTQRILGAQQIHVAGPSQTIHGSQSLSTVTGDADLRVSGTRTIRVDGDQRVEVRGAEQREVHGDVIERVRGSHALVVGDAGAPRSFTLHAEGTTTLRSSQDLVLESASGITLKVGKTQLRITEHGIELHGDSVLVKGKEGEVQAGEDGITLRTTKKAEIAADTVHLHTTGDATVISMKKDVKIAGSKILLNSPEQSRDLRPEDPPTATTIQLSDQAGAPIPHQRFVVLLGDKKERGGVLDADGKAELLLDPGKAKIRFPDLPPSTLNTSPTWVPHVVQSGEYLDKIAHRLGFQAEVLWGAPKNQELRKLRPSPNLLSPGDVLWVPKGKETGGEVLSVGAANRYERRVPRIKVVTWLHRSNGTPVANEPCEVRGLGLQVTSSAEGKVELDLPIHVREVELWIPSLQISQPILVGDLDPADTGSGLKQRLTNLGYNTYHGFDDAPGDAITKFQKDHGLPLTGVADTATLDALKSNHDRTGEA